jgi:HPt (histidine-containing phosphotransfer) domain-containing protein
LRLDAETGGKVKAASPERRPEPIDESVLEGLCQLHPDHRPDIAKNLVTMFVETSPLVLQRLKEAAARSDAAALRRESHILVSSSAAVGARLLSSECKDLEESAIMGSVPDGAARVRAITRLCEEAEIALRAWCAGRG